MIAKLRGIIDTIGEDFCIVDVNGVGYLVFASAKTLGRLARGQEAALQYLGMRAAGQKRRFQHPLRKIFQSIRAMLDEGGQDCNR